MGRRFAKRFLELLRRSRAAAGLSAAVLMFAQTRGGTAAERDDRQLHAVPHAVDQILARCIRCTADPCDLFSIPQTQRTAGLNGRVSVGDQSVGDLQLRLLGPDGQYYDVHAADHLCGLLRKASAARHVFVRARVPDENAVPVLCPRDPLLVFTPCGIQAAVSGFGDRVRYGGTRLFTVYDRLKQLPRHFSGVLRRIRYVPVRQFECL